MGWFWVGCGAAALSLNGPACSLSTQGELADNGANDASVGGAAQDAGYGGDGSGAKAGGGGSGNAAGKAGYAGSGGIGSGGASGSSGSAGMSGVAGTAGIGGAGGSAGSSGLGGAAGDAGAGGVAGTGGACGTTEDCTNGVDDNCDGKVDCQDPKCAKAGYVSVPSGPGGADYEYYHERNAGDAPATCASTLTIMKLQLDAPIATCPCECGAVQGASCTGAGKPTVWQNPNCGGFADTLPAAWNVCRANADTTWVVKSWVTGAFQVSSAGTCASSVSSKIPAASFAKQVDLCKVPAVGVGSKAGESCVLPGSAPYDASLCVLVPGDVDCKSILGYAHPHAYFTDLTDNRQCGIGTCSCDNAAGTKCAASIKFYSDAQCTASLADVAVPDGNCHDLPGGGYAGGMGSYKGELTVTPGTCAAKGAGALTGAVTPNGVSTLCCPN